MKRRKFIQNTGLLAVGSVTLTSLSSHTTNLKTTIKPKALQKGDVIAITAPAGAIFNKTHITKFEKRLHDLGYKTIKGKSLYQQKGYLAGSDDFRVNELHNFIKNKSVKAIIAMRGGWGCGRLLDKLDYELIKQNPKIIMGYSDITSLLIKISQQTGLITFHGPVGYSSWKSFSTQQFNNVVVDAKQVVMQNPSNYKNDLKTLTKGVVKGELIGGNLTVITSMIGTKHEPNWHNKILFLEETGEEPYRIDRMLWQLKQANVFKQINGVVLGAFTKCNPDEPEKSFSLDEVLNQYFKNKTLPVYKGATFGHIIPKFTLPIGVCVEIDSSKFTIKMLEQAVLK